MRRGWPASAAHVKEERGESQREGSHGLEDERQELLARGTSLHRQDWVRHPLDLEDAFDADGVLASEEDSAVDAGFEEVDGLLYVKLGVHCSLY